MSKEKSDWRKHYLTWEGVKQGSTYLARRIQQDIHKEVIKGPINTIVAFPRGGLPIAAMLGHLLDIKDVMTDQEFHMRNASGRLWDGNYLVVDDIFDTGATFTKFLQNAAREGLYGHQRLITTALYWRSSTLVVPNYVAYDACEDWIVFPWELDSVVSEEVK